MILESDIDISITDNDRDPTLRRSELRLFRRLDQENDMLSGVFC